MVPVWAELLGDLETPVAAFAKLVGDEPGFLLESVEHGERWSRFSFVGRNPSATMVLRDGRLTVEGELPASVPTDQGMLAAIEALLAVVPSPVVDELPPLHGGVMGYLGYDVVREVEQLPERARRRSGLPDAVMSVIGSLAAFDHWRQRVYLIESVPHARPRRRRARRRLRRGGRCGVDAAVDRARPAAAVRARRAAARPARRCRPCGRRCPAACTSRRSRWPRSTSSPATSSRSCWRSATTSSSTPTRSTCTGCCARSTRARTCTSCATPS